MANTVSGSTPLSICVVSIATPRPQRYYGIENTDEEQCDCLLELSLVLGQNRMCRRVRVFLRSERRGVGGRVVPDTDSVWGLSTTRMSSGSAWCSSPAGTRWGVMRGGVPIV